MSPRSRSAAVACTIAIVLPAHLAAQEPIEVKVVVPAPQAATAPRFDVGPTLAALTKATRDTPPEQRTVASSAWVVLALLANGSTLREGPSRAEVREHTKWLIEQQYVTGFAVGTELCPRNEQLLGALAITEACEVSASRAYAHDARLGITNAALTMRGKVRPANDEEFVLAMLLARRTAAMRDPWISAPIHAARNAARSHLVGSTVRRTDAALHLDDLLQGKQHPPELTIAKAWPANPTTDPLHTLIGALAVSLLPLPEKQRDAQVGRLSVLVAARETDGQHAGTWAPAGGFDRCATTAMHAITLALANGKVPLFCAK